LAFLFCLFLGGSGALGGPLETELVFIHIGPEDASIPPFTVKTGDAAKSSLKTFFVTEVAYKRILELVEKSEAVLDRRPRPLGTFQVILRGPEFPERLYRVYPERMEEIIVEISGVFKDRNLEIPQTLAILGRLVKH